MGSHYCTVEKSSHMGRTHYGIMALSGSAPNFQLPLIPLQLFGGGVENNGGAAFYFELRVSSIMSKLEWTPLVGKYGGGEKVFNTQTYLKKR